MYARVRNRGTQDATSVNVRLYYADPSTSLTFPHDWNDGQTGVAAKGSITVSGSATDLQTLATVPANGSFVTPVPFVWRPPDPTTATQSQVLADGRVRGHFCLLSRLTTIDDPIIFPGGGESSVINDNNISMKNEEVYSAVAGGMFTFHFYTRYARVANVREFQLVADVSGLPGADGDRNRDSVEEDRAEVHRGARADGSGKGGDRVDGRARLFGRGDGRGNGDGVGYGSTGAASGRGVGAGGVRAAA